MPADHRARVSESVLPETLTLDEAFRAAYFLVDLHVGLEADPGENLALFHQYLLSDPARWTDWLASVKKAIADPTAAYEKLHD